MRKARYGYKVCYKQHGRQKLKLYLVTNTYDSAEWSVRWYKTKAPPDKETKRPLESVTWLIIPIKTYLEYKRLWRGCPF